MYKVTTKVKNYCGVSCGVKFVDGCALTDNLKAISYFKSSGYTVESLTEEDEVMGENALAPVSGVDEDSVKPLTPADFQNTVISESESTIEEIVFEDEEE